MENLRAVKTIIGQLNYILSRKQKKRTVLLLICMLIGSSLELLGVSAIYPFLELLLQTDSLPDKWYVGIIRSLMPNISMRGVLLVIGVTIILVYVLKNLFMVLNLYVQNSYAAKFQRETSTRMLDTYMKRPYQYFLNTNSSEILRGITTDIQGVYQILLAFFTMLTELLNVLVLGVFLFYTDWITALSAMLLAGLCFFGIIMGFKKILRRAGEDMRAANALKNQYGYQAVNGIKEITVLDRRQNFVGQFDKAAALEQRSATINGFMSSCPDRILEGICIGGFMGIVCLRIATREDFSSFVPIFGTFAVGAFRILPSISKVSSRINTIIFFKKTLLNTYDNLKAVEQYERETAQYAAGAPADDNLRFAEELRIKSISWKYQNTDHNILEHASLTIRRGESVAFVGASGAGKTTLADIIMGLLKPQEGCVEMDGADIFAIPHQWARIIGYVPQSVFLTDDSIRRNVAFGLDTDSISDEKVWHALGQAQLKSFVQGLPQGLDTIVGERGIKLSGGQRQRIAIARALYEDPDILVLDEATSALDNETESAVMESIESLQGSKTLIIVAHRLTTIRNCDRIFEITDGLVTEKNVTEFRQS